MLVDCNKVSIPSILNTFSTVMFMGGLVHAKARVVRCIGGLSDAKCRTVISSAILF
jgi:hypothetical protein